MKENVIKEKNVKIPLYVTVYETISEWLKEGKYKPGDKLPGENILAEQLNVAGEHCVRLCSFFRKTGLSSISREEEILYFPPSVRQKQD